MGHALPCTPVAGRLLRGRAPALTCQRSHACMLCCAQQPLDLASLAADLRSTACREHGHRKFAQHVSAKSTADMATALPRTNLRRTSCCPSRCQSHPPARDTWRLACAAPPEQRGPEVSAFLESVQLCREVCELLPLAPSGRPALPTILTRFVLQTIELALAKLWQALDLCPCACAPVCDANLWEPLKVYLEHRTPGAVANLIHAIGMAGPHSATEGSDTQASSGGDGGSSGSGSGSGSSGSSGSGRPACPEATTARGGSADSDCSSDGEIDGSADPVGPHGVYIRPALRVALLLATCGRCCQFPLVGARLLRATIDIASDLEYAAAIDRPFCGPGDPLG